MKVETIMFFSINGIKGYAFNKPNFWVRYFVLSDVGVLLLPLLAFIITAVSVIGGFIGVAGFLMGFFHAFTTLFLTTCLFGSLLLAYMLMGVVRGLHTKRREIINHEHRAAFVIDDDYSYVLVMKVLQRQTQPNGTQLDDLFGTPRLIKYDTLVFETDKKQPEEIEAHYNAKYEITILVQAEYSYMQRGDFQAVAQLLQDQRDAAQREQHSMAHQLCIKLETDLESMEALARRTGLHAV